MVQRSKTIVILKDTISFVILALLGRSGENLFLISEKSRIGIDIVGLNI